MLFSLRMLWREARALWRQMLFFFLCIAVGSGLVITLRSAVQNIRVALVRQTRAFIGADLEVRMPYRRVAALRPQLDEVLVTFPDATRTDVVEFETGIVAGRDEPVRIFVRAVDERYPLEGEVALQGVTYRYDLLAGRGAVVAPTLLDRLGIGVGSPLKIGQETFTIRGVLKRETTSRAFGALPTVLLSSADLKTTGLLTTDGLTANYFIRLRVGDRLERIEELAAALRRALAADKGVRVETARAREARVAERLEETENFFSLVGVAVIMLGGAGVAGATYTIIGQRIRTIAVLKCLGASSRLVFRLYALQMALLGLAGGVFGWAGAALARRLFGPRVAARFPFPVTFELTWSAIGQGVGVSLIAALAFSVVPLLSTRGVKPSVLLRSQVEALHIPLRWAVPVGLAATAVLYALFLWQAGTFNLGNAVFQATAVTLAGLYGVGWTLMRLAWAARRVTSFTIRYGLAALRRPGNQATAIVVTVGVGVFFALTVRLLERNIRYNLDLAVAENLPNLIVANVLPSQAEAVGALVERQVQVRPTLVPIISARITAINDRRINFAAIKDASRRAAVDREFRLTYRADLLAGEQLVDGEWWSPSPSDTLELSLETFTQRNLGVRVGDRLTLDIQGREVVGVIRNIRRIDPRRSWQFFAIVARPGGPLDQAPQTLFGAVRTPAVEKSPETFQKLYLEVVRAYPNVSVALTGDAVRVAREILTGIQTALGVIGGLVVLSGLAMLVGAVALTRYQRQYETALLKTLGARFATLIGVTVIEYGALGVTAAVIGGGSALGASWYLAQRILRIEWQPFWGDCLAGVVATVVLVVAVGSLASWDVLRRKPLSVLRSGD
ncbi:MAG: FtsX-like permease family protein [Chloracidobacterium sp.]|nr:FtsX-like permease family protein [Chloracidobacterium sp.]MDW8217127.1 FtsX-like permease family protein [Acidobacteriota bacterium]